MSAEQTERWTVLKLLEWTTDFFKNQGSASPRLDAELLLSEAMNCERIELYTAFNEEPDEQVRAAFRELVRRRGEGTPVAHLLGRKEFYSLNFRISEDTLIPRPETEHLVIEALDVAKSQSFGSDMQIADVGTGSGIIAVSLAKHLPEVNVTATDTSAAALRIAQFNAEAHGVQQCIEFVEADLLSCCPEQPRFHLVCSNPPYVSDSEYAQLDPSVRDYEPKSALVGGPSGTEIIKRLIDQAFPRLHPAGRLIFEMSPMIAGEALEYIAGIDVADDVKVIKDLAGHDRIVSVAHR